MVSGVVAKAYGVRAEQGNFRFAGQSAHAVEQRRIATQARLGKYQRRACARVDRGREIVLHPGRRPRNQRKVNGVGRGCNVRIARVPGDGLVARRDRKQRRFGTKHTRSRNRVIPGPTLPPTGADDGN